MGKQFNDNNRGGRGGHRGNQRGGRGNFDQGPPSFVVPYGTFMHQAENNFLVKCTDMTRFPKFNRGIYLENKSKVGVVDEILGPINDFMFSVKPADGIKPSSFKAGQVLYASPEDLLSMDRFNNKKPQGGKKTGGPRGNFQKGGPGGFNKGGSGGFNKGGSGGFNNRGGSGGFRGGSSRGGFRGKR